MTPDIYLVGEKYPFLMTTSFFIKDKVKFLQIKKDTMRQKCCQKHDNYGEVRTYTKA